MSKYDYHYRPAEEAAEARRAAAMDVLAAIGLGLAGALILFFGLSQ